MKPHLYFDPDTRWWFCILHRDVCNPNGRFAIGATPVEAFNNFLSDQ